MEFRGGGGGGTDVVEKVAVWLVERVAADVVMVLWCAVACVV